MVKTSVLIVEPNIEWANELASELNLFNLNTIIRSQVELDDELEAAGNQFSICVINAIMPNMEGYTLYSYLQTLNNWKTASFVLVADEEHLANSLKLLKPERAVVAWKGEGTGAIVQKIVNQIPIDAYSENEYYPEFSGKIYSGYVNDIIDFLKITYASGKLILSEDTEYCILQFEHGEIVDTLHSFLSGESALNNVLAWERGNYRFERKRATYDDIHQLVTKKRLELKNAQEISVDLSDILTDLFSALYHFLAHQLNPQQVNEIYMEKLELFKKRYPTLKKCIFAPFGESVLIFKEQVVKEEIKAYLHYFESIIRLVYQKYPDLDFENLKMAIEELSPFLKNFNIFESVLENIDSVCKNTEYMTQLTTSSKIAFN